MKTLKEDIKIRKFRIEDYDDVIKLWSVSKLPYKPLGRDSKEKILQEITQPQCIFLVAAYKGNLIAVALGTHDGRKGWINRVAVSPKFRRKGVARLLINELEEKLSKAGINIIACLIEEDNEESKHLFKALNYIKHNDIIYFTKRKNIES